MSMWNKWIDVQFLYRLKLNVTAVGVDYNKHSVQQANAIE